LVKVGREMPRVTVYKVKIYDIIADEVRLSRRMATEKGALTMGGEIVQDTATEIDDSQLEAGQEWTPKDFAP
jgi:hypothetical protein